MRERRPLLLGVRTLAMRSAVAAPLLAVLTGATTILALSAPEEARASTSGSAGIVLGAPCVPIDPDTRLT